MKPDFRKKSLRPSVEERWFGKERLDVWALVVIPTVYLNESLRYFSTKNSEFLLRKLHHTRVFRPQREIRSASL